MWDRLRIAAFIDVVSFHITSEHALLGVGLPLFLILTFGLGVRRPSPQPAGEFLRLRFRRLVVPWLAWSALFGTIRAEASLRHHAPLSKALHLDMLLYGTEQYLWFLPFAAIGGFATYLLDRTTQRVPTAWLVAGCLAVATTLLGVLDNFHCQFPFGWWLFGAPAIPIGLAAGRMLARPTAKTGWLWLGVLTASLVATAFLLSCWKSATPLSLVAPLRYAMAVALLGAGALLPDFTDRWTSRLQPLLLGGYLLHSAVYFRLVNRVAQAGHVRLTPIVAVVGTVCLTLALVAVLRRTRVRSIL